MLPWECSNIKVKRQVLHVFVYDEGGRLGSFDLCRPNLLDFSNYSSVDLDLGFHPSQVPAVSTRTLFFSSLNLGLGPFHPDWRPCVDWTLNFSSYFNLDLGSLPSRVEAVCRPDTQLLQLLQPGPGLSSIPSGGRV